MSDDAPRPARVLVAEDEAHLGLLLEQFLSARGHRVRLVRDGQAALAALQGDAYDVAITDVQMPGMDGLALLAAAQALPLAPEVIVVTGNGAAETQLRALRGGAYDAVGKPYRMAELELKVQRAREKRGLRLHQLRASLGEPPCGPSFVAADDATAAARARVEALVGERAGPVVLVGEPGTGRRTLARSVWPVLGPTAPFLAVGPQQLLGAADPVGHAGVLARLAAGGMLLVRDADALDPGVLDALLAGDADEGPLVVLAVPPGAALAMRFAGRAVTLPPLRARPRDVLALAARFASRHAGLQDGGIAEDAAEWLLARPWPGNVAELAAVVAAAVPRWTDRTRPLPAAALAPAR